MERAGSRSSLMESTKLHQQKRGSSSAINPVSPSQTLWSSSDVGNSGNFKNVDRDKGINVQVILRCRPLSEEERGAKAPIVISCDEEKRQVAAIQNIGNKQIDKTFVFDKVFGPTSKQKELYDQVAAPIVNDALQGYNCTIFAYGQTGTGKTYTMEGGGGRGKEQNGEFYEDAGVIPRAVEQIFDILEAQNAEYIMKVTFIELYNEEITDLLAPDHDSSQFFDEKSKKLITPMEDGKGAVFIKGLEEQIVSSADEIYKILEKGSARKHTAETLLNKQSNRSHSLLTITVQVKECSSEGVELVKCGRLNLVDLAGSENILRSGAREGRAREAGEINKSLLTLGRVINALVEHSGHVPYRDSKLTRLLRDSLGGKTKTCITATVSPSISSLEETLNTLDYAFRAKNIKNRPEINQKVVKAALIKDLYVEVNHLKQELQATREKNGVFVPRDRYLSEEASKKAMVKKLARMELDSEFKDKQLRDLQELFLYQQNLTAALSEKIGNNDSIAVRNRVLIESFQTQLAQHLENLHKMVEGSVKQQERQLKEVEDHTQSFVSEKERATEDLRARLTKLKDMFGRGIKTLVDLAGELDGTSKAAFGTIKSEVSKHSSDIGELVREISSTADLIVDDLQNDLNSQEKSVAAFTQQQQENCSRTYQMTQSVSRVTVDFFKTLITYISKVSLMVEEARTVDEQKLNTLQKKFEENADNEEKELLDKVAELLANSKSKKKQLIQAEIGELRDSTVCRTSKLHQEMSTMQGLTSSAEEEWTGFLEKTEKHYDEDVKAVEGGKHSVITALNNCLRKARTDRERWMQLQESLLSLQERNVDSVDSIIKDTVEANKVVHSRLSSIALSALEEAVVTHSSSLYSIDHLLRLDQDAKEKLNSLTGPCNEDMKEMENVHAEKIVEITETAEKCLTIEFTQENSLLSTPTKTPSTLSSTAGSDELKTPPFEEQLQLSRKTGSRKHVHSDLNKSWDSHQADYSDPSLSLAAINVRRTEEC